MNTLTRPAIKVSSMSIIVTVNNVAHRFAAVRPQRFYWMFPHSRSLLIAAPQFQTTVVSKNIDPIRKFIGVSASNVPFMRYSTTTSNYELLYEKELADHAVTKRELRLEIEARKEAEVKLAIALEQNYEYKLLLGIRTEIERLEEFLWPVGMKKKKQQLNRTEVWTRILTSPDPAFAESCTIQEFRNRLLQERISAEFFIEKCVLSIYKQTSDVGAHKVKLPSRDDINEKIIGRMLETIGLPVNRAFISTVKIILTPFQAVG